MKPATGQRVRWSSRFLLKIYGAEVPGNASLHGTITKVAGQCGKDFFVRVLWDGDQKEQLHICSGNLEFIDEQTV